MILIFSFAGSACRAVNSASGNEKYKIENPDFKDETVPKTAEANRNRETKIVAEIEGKYKFSTYKKRKVGNENYLMIKKNGNGKIHVSFEGTNFFMAGKEETFHDAAGEGDLVLKGNTASGKLLEEGSENACPVTLTFMQGKVALKSSNCDMNVSPDGVYTKTADQKEDIDGSYGDVPEEKEDEQSAKTNAKPFVRYDDAGNPNAVLNLMATEENREGCGENESSFQGKVMTVDNPDEFVYEFVLAGSDRKRQKLSLVVSEDDDLAAKDLLEIIKTGANLKVNYINCGNAPIASPTAIYKQ